MFNVIILIIVIIVIVLLTGNVAKHPLNAFHIAYVVPLLAALCIVGLGHAETNLEKGLFGLSGLTSGIVFAFHTSKLFKN